jgi:hypothetical protein
MAKAKRTLPCTAQYREELQRCVQKTLQDDPTLHTLEEKQAFLGVWEASISQDPSIDLGRLRTELITSMMRALSSSNKEVKKLYRGLWKRTFERFYDSHLRPEGGPSKKLKAERDSQGGEASSCAREQQVVAAEKPLRSRKVPRQRPPRLKRRDLNVLQLVEERLGNQWPIIETPLSKSAALSIEHDLPEPQQQLGPASSPPEYFLANLPHGAAAPSTRGPQTRGDYMHGRKWPQVCWMNEAIEKLVTVRSAHGSKPGVGCFQHILDVGGGRGDLALQVAQQFPSSRVTVIDQNRQSLEQGRAGAHRLQLTNLSFVEGDFTSVQLAPALKDVDLVVALHACGGLTDAILKFSTSREVPFLVCPCCFLRNKGAEDVCGLLAKEGTNSPLELGWPQAWRFFDADSTSATGGSASASLSACEQKISHGARHTEVPSTDAAQYCLQMHSPSTGKGLIQECMYLYHKESFTTTTTTTTTDTTAEATPGVMSIPHREVLQRLAESKARNISIRAMRCINTLRLSACAHNLKQRAKLRQDETLLWVLQMQSFSEEFSLRNVVLCGSLGADESE